MTTQPWENEKLLKRPSGHIGQYVGARYVPKLMDDWSDQVKYDYLCQVNYFGDAYISKLPVPLGTPPTDTTYWMRFPYGAKIDDIYAQIADANAKIAKNAQDIVDLDESIRDAMAGLTVEFGNEVNQIKADVNRLGDRVTVNEGMITTLQQGVVKLDGDIKKVDQKATMAISDVENLEERVQSNTESIGNINTSINQINTKIANHETRITALEAGGGDAPVIEQILETINVEHPPASLQGMTKNSAVPEKEKFEAIVEYAKSNKMSITFPSGTWNVGASVVPQNVYIKGNGTESKISGSLNLQGTTGLITIVESVEFLDNLTIGIDVKIDSCIFRNCGINANGNQEYIINSQFYLTDSTKTLNAVRFAKENQENVRIMNCLVISELGIDNAAFNLQANGVRDVSIIGCQVIGVKKCLISSITSPAENIIMSGCDIYNTKQPLAGSFNGAITACTISSDSDIIPIQLFHSNMNISGCYCVLKSTGFTTVALQDSYMGLTSSSFFVTGRIWLDSNAKLNVSGSQCQATTVSLGESTLLASASSVEFFSSGWTSWDNRSNGKAKVYGCINGNGEIPGGEPNWVTVL